MWRDATVIAILGMGWVFLFISLFVCCVKVIAWHAEATCPKKEAE